MAFPANIGSGRVVGRFIFGVVDGPDENEEPDLIPARGTITFTPSVSYMTNISADGEAAVFAPTAVDGILDEDGYLCTPDPADKAVAGYRGVRLFATEDPDLSVNGWTWAVTYRLAAGVGHSVTIPSHSTPILEGEVHDLATMVKTPSSPGVGIPQYEAAILRAEAAAVAAQEAVESGGGGAGGVGPEGPQGPQGPQGDPGIDGTDGADSVVPGPAGEPGVDGQDGARGPDGADSVVPGPKGDDGAQGPAGDDGPKGDPGTAASLPNNVIRAVHHDGSSWPARPSGGAAITVHWIGGTGDPADFVDGDLITQEV